MNFKPEEIIEVGEHKSIRRDDVVCEIEPHTVEDVFLEFDVDARDSEGNDFHHRFTFPKPLGKPGLFPDHEILGKILHVDIIEFGKAKFSLN